MQTTRDYPQSGQNNRFENWSSSQLRKTMDLIDLMPSGGGDLAIVRVYQPLATTAFSRRETFLPGFADAVEVAEHFGYAPVIRLTGGRCVVYDQNSVVIDAVIPDNKLGKTSEQHFSNFANWFASHLGFFGIDARVGQLPGEFCPGPYSVNASGEIKIVGTAQRVLRGARLISSVIQLSDSETPRSVMTEINKAMSFDWDPSTFGAVEDKSLMFYNRDFRESVSLGMQCYVESYTGGLETTLVLE